VECLDRWLFSGVRDAQQIVEAWREEYNLHLTPMPTRFRLSLLLVHSLGAGHAQSHYLQELIGVLQR
jgi:hypothetical protein